MGDKPTVFEAWSAVMHEVQSIEKGEFNKVQGFRFRGIDAVMDAVGPALRKHGVIVVPTVAAEYDSTAYETRGRDGKPPTGMINRIVRTTFTVFGPAGDSFTGVTFGEAADSGDKALTKAQTVALRVFLLQALAVPSGDVDPDALSHERMAEQTPPRTKTDADAAREELLKAATGLGWRPNKLAQRFRDDYGLDVRIAEAPVIRGFTAAIVAEAQSQDKDKGDGPNPE